MGEGRPPGERPAADRSPDDPAPRLPAGALFVGPVKRSMTIAGHTTSISLEPLFWEALEAAAARARLPLSALVARVDAARIAVAAPPNLASALRCWLFHDALTARQEGDQPQSLR